MVYKSKPMPEAYARVEWCKTQFGGTGEPKWDQLNGGVGAIVKDLRWWRRQGHLFFRNEKDYLLYCLRWA